MILKQETLNIFKDSEIKVISEYIALLLDIYILVTRMAHISHITFIT